MHVFDNQLIGRRFGAVSFTAASSFIRREKQFPLWIEIYGEQSGKVDWRKGKKKTVHRLELKVLYFFFQLLLFIDQWHISLTANFNPHRYLHATILIILQIIFPTGIVYKNRTCSDFTFYRCSHEMSLKSIRSTSKRAAASNVKC